MSKSPEHPSIVASSIMTIGVTGFVAASSSSRSERVPGNIATSGFLFRPSDAFLLFSFPLFDLFLLFSFSFSFFTALLLSRSILRLSLMVCKPASSQQTETEELDDSPDPPDMHEDADSGRDEDAVDNCDPERPCAKIPPPRMVASVFRSQ